MPKPKKLIEVAMPIKEISAESVRDKSIRHGHISTLHLWWARRPLPVCRAVVFASLVPDPLDENCPQQFRDAVEILLGSVKNPLHEKGMESNAYKPYEDIPYTAAADKMEDNLRNRLLMFIGKYSKEFCDNEKSGKTTASGKQLSDYSLIKWDNKNNEDIINKARKLIWVSHNAGNSNLSAKDLLNDFETHYQAIKDGEQELYALTDRHIETKSVKLKTQKLHNAIEAFLDKMPKVFDPFAGGGAIPLEAARLGCRSFGNDINPVAHIIQKGSLEFPQKYGKPITYSKKEFLTLYGEEEWNKISNDDFVYEHGEPTGVKIANRLSFDVEFYANKLLAETEKEIGHLYPANEKGNKPIAYYWARVGTCGNPSCKAEVPLLKGFYLANTKTKQVYLKPIINGKKIDFEITKGNCTDEGWIARGNMQCPVCGNTTDVKTLKQQFVNSTITERMLAVVWDSKEGKIYKLPSQEETSDCGKHILEDHIPDEKVNQSVPQLFNGGGWGIYYWKEIFNTRQKALLSNLLVSLFSIKKLLTFETEYRICLSTYLAILIDRLIERQTRFSIWHTKRETFEKAFQRHDIPIVLDYPESNPFGDKTGSALSQIDWIIRYIESEASIPFQTICNNTSSGEITQFSSKFLDAAITDPPYYDAIPYADISDFFYIWLKKMLFSEYVQNFATPLTNKSEECTTLRHHHNSSSKEAKIHFETKLQQIFSVIEKQTSDVVSIMFAHQSTEAWTTLCNSILGARMNITGSWAFDSEQISAIKSNQAYLSSSVTVACRPVQQSGLGEFREVKKAIEKTIEKEVEVLYQLGFRGADLLTACFGQAVSEFGKYEKVEKADGSEVTVAELLEMARESAFNALLKGFEGDEYTKFYIGWLQLYSFAESDFDDAAKFSRVGLSINVSELFNEHILIKNGNKQTLGTFEQRLHANKNLGERADSNLIDLVHRAMALYKGSNRNVLLKYIADVASQPENSFWRVITSLCEVLPTGSEDHKQALGLLTNKESLIRESKVILSKQSEQTQLFE